MILDKERYFRSEYGYAAGLCWNCRQSNTMKAFMNESGYIKYECPNCKQALTPDGKYLTAKFAPKQVA